MEKPSMMSCRAWLSSNPMTGKAVMATTPCGWELKTVMSTCE
jgi:hypothetical protein